MNSTEIKSLYDTVKSFYLNRKQTLRYSTVNGQDVLFDNKVVFLGTLSHDKTKPADGKALLLVWNDFNTIAIRCLWMDAQLEEEYVIRVRILKKPLWQLKIPGCLSSVSVGNQEKEPFCELGEPILYEGYLLAQFNDGECFYYHDYEARNIAFYSKIDDEYGDFVELIDEKDVHPELLKAVGRRYLYFKQYLKNGQPKFAFDLDRNKFSRV